MKLIQVKKNGIIYFENVIDKYIYVIKKGKIKLIKEKGMYLVNEDLKKSKELKAGDAFGFQEILTDRKREDRAVALEESEIVYFEKEEFSNVLKKNIKLGERILNSISNNIRNLNNKIKNISNENIYEESKNIKNIYLYFLKMGEFQKANKILERIKETGKDLEFVEKEVKNTHIIKGGNITEKTIDILKENYVEDKEILQSILIGLNKKIFKKKLKEKVVFELLKLIDDEKEYIENVEKTIEEFVESDYGKKLRYELVRYYEKRNQLSEALRRYFFVSTKKEKNFII
ncbi:MAG: hypothetical protein B6I28_05415 [Fusobacteriia bacterium 4572_132]|nr:MAG: hypothetical protein B6I28_05415 [Fusobacteriia bacterium 4572_132]